MAKRFTDSDKWKKPLIRSLQAPYKLLWLYILDDCDHAGIWQVDMPVAEIRIGEKLDEKEAIKSFGDKIVVIDNGEKWFIKDFIEFQYGELNPTNRVHESVLTILKKYKIKEHISPLQRAKDKDKDKEKDKVRDKDKEPVPQLIEFLAYVQEKSTDYLLIQESAKLKYESWIENGWKDGNDKPIGNWKTKLLNTIPHLKKIDINKLPVNQNVDINSF